MSKHAGDIANAIRAMGHQVEEASTSDDLDSAIASGDFDLVIVVGTNGEMTGCPVDKDMLKMLLSDSCGCVS